MKSISIALPIKAQTSHKSRNKKVQAEIRIKLVDAVYKSNLAKKESGWTEDKAEKYVDSLLSVSNEYAEVLKNRKELGDVDVEISKATKDDRIQMSHDSKAMSGHQRYHSQDTYNMYKGTESKRHENFVEKLDIEDFNLDTYYLQNFNQQMINLYNFTRR